MPYRLASKAIFKARTCTYIHEYNSPVMTITWGMKPKGNIPPGHSALLILHNKWLGIFYMPGHTDMAGHTKAFELPLHGPLVGVKVLQHNDD